MKRWSFFLSAVILFVSITGQAAFPAEEKRNCFGMLWCSIETEDGESFDALFYLYSTEQRGNFSKLAIRPFYYSERDPEADYLQRSVLWPLGKYERKGEQSSAHLLPFYWHGKSSNRRYTLFLPLYLNYEEGLQSYFHIVPFYGHHSRGKDFDRYYIFGPLSITTRDAQRGLRQWDILYPLFSHRRDKKGSRGRLIPIYFFGNNKETGISYRYLLNYGHEEGPELGRRYLFPVFGSETEKVQGEYRFSLIGFPPISVLRLVPTLALYEHLSAPDRISDRLFPIYRYVKWLEEERTEIDALLLYRHDASPGRVTDRLFPFYRYDHDLDNRALRLSFIGHRESSFLWYERDATRTRHHLFPVYSYQNAMTGEQRFGLLGHGRFSLFLKERTRILSAHHLFPLYRYRKNLESGTFRLDALLFYKHVGGGLMTSDRFFPVYSYENNRETGEIRWNALQIYRHKETGTTTKDALLPVYTYENDQASGLRHVALLGVPPFTLYEHRVRQDEISNWFFPIYAYHADSEGMRFSVLGFPRTGGGTTFSLYERTRTALKTTDRFFPLYAYANNLETGEVRWDALLIYRHKKTEFYTKDAFLPLYSYENDRANQVRRFGLLGMAPLTLYEHRVTAEETTDHLFPFYGYRGTEDERIVTMLGLPPSMSSLHLAFILDRRSSSGITNRFFPFYRYEKDRVAQATRFALIGHRELSLLWIDTDPSTTRHHLFPAYSYHRDSIEGISSLGILGPGDLSLYRHRHHASGFSDRLFPLYDYETEGEGHSLSLFGISKIALFRKEKAGTHLIHRFFPLYRYGKDFQNNETSLNVLLYWHRTTAETVADYLPPVFSFRRNRFSPEWRLTALGLDPLVPISLFRQIRSAEGASGFLFPLYDYTRHGSDSSLTIGGLSAISLYRYRKDAEKTRHRLFPVYGYWKERETGEWKLGVLGIPPLSLYQHHAGPNGTRDRLFPIYGYTSDVETETFRFNALGFREFSLYQHVKSPTGIKDRLVPLYDYSHDREKEETRFNALLIARYRSNLSGKKVSLLPLFSYEREENGDESRFGLLGVAPISLYQHLKTSEQVSDRFFPIYEYSYERGSQFGRFKVLWPLFDRKSMKGDLTELRIFHWLMSYERPAKDRKEFRIFGGSAIALLRWKVTPEMTRFEFNPIIPFYVYESVKGQETKWSFLGGLIGRENNEAGEAKMRWLWFL